MVDLTEHQGKIKPEIQEGAFGKHYQALSLKEASYQLRRQSSLSQEETNHLLLLYYYLAS